MLAGVRRPGVGDKADPFGDQPGFSKLETCKLPGADEDGPVEVEDG